LDTAQNDGPSERGDIAAADRRSVNFLGTASVIKSNLFPSTRISQKVRSGPAIARKKPEIPAATRNLMFFGY
jgi:hypothetical protein